MTRFQAGRRRLLQRSTAAIAAAAAFPGVQAQGSGAAARAPVVAQIVDVSMQQQDVSKDFLIGSRAAWADLAKRPATRARPAVQHLAIETDGSPASLRAALAQVRDNPACVALSGTVAALTARQLTDLLRAESLQIAHAAPWLQDAAVVDDRTFPIFATRQDQIVHALKSLSTMGVQELAVIYATPSDHALQHEGMERTAKALQIRLQSFQANGDDLRALGQRLNPGTPAILLFVGGTPELARFTQGLDKQARQRYLIALADVNLQTLMQMGAGRHTPVIGTQPVPMVNASLPVVRAYREVLARLFDEPPSPLSLAGFLAARYTSEVLDDVDGPLTRANVLVASQKRAAIDLGGYRISFNPQRFGSTYVTQSMLSADGRVVG